MHTLRDRLPSFSFVRKGRLPQSSRYRNALATACMRLTESSLRIALFRQPTTVCDERSRMIAISSLLLPAADYSAARLFRHAKDAVAL
jgi:hypothetical protein